MLWHLELLLTLQVTIAVSRASCSFHIVEALHANDCFVMRNTSRSQEAYGFRSGDGGFEYSRGLLRTESEESRSPAYRGLLSVPQL
jgi:hypothetical protein